MGLNKPLPSSGFRGEGAAWLPIGHREFKTAGSGSLASYDARGRAIKIVYSGTLNSNVQAEYGYGKTHNGRSYKVTGAPNRLLRLNNELHYLGSSRPKPAVSSLYGPILFLPPRRNVFRLRMVGRTLTPRYAPAVLPFAVVLSFGAPIRGSSRWISASAIRYALLAHSSTGQ